MRILGALAGASTRDGNPCLPEGVSVITASRGAAKAATEVLSKTAIAPARCQGADFDALSGHEELGIIRLPIKLVIWTLDDDQFYAKRLRAS